MSQQDLRKPGSVLKIGMVIAIAIILASGLTAGGIKLWNKHQIDTENAAIKAEVAREESQDEKYGPLTLSAADAYVADFADVSNVDLTKDGFNPLTITIKPKTKVIFKSGDGQTYKLVAVAGSAVPKYFVANSEVSAHSLVQLKFETEGTYTFTEGQEPSHTISITVAK